MTEKFIDWRFNLLGTPHRGGIWEAAVKSAKSFIPKVTIMTYEELETSLARIEMLLNSRPFSYRRIADTEFEILTTVIF